MQYRKLTELKKLTNNPRIIRDKEFKNLCRSIKDNPKFFEARPLILSDRTGDLVIIAGNQRFEAAKAAGLKEAPTYLMQGLTEEKEREITIRDNTQQGEWDMDLLSAWDNFPLIDWGIKIPQAWTAPPSEEKEPDGTMRSVFNDGKGEADETEERSGDGTAEHFPVTFVLSESEWGLWVSVKARLKLKDDKAAFLKMIGGKHA